MGHLRRFESLSARELSQLTTPRLLAYRKKMLKLENSLELSDRQDDFTDALDDRYIYFKDSPEYVAADETLRAELAKREHVERSS